MSKSWPDKPDNVTLRSGLRIKTDVPMASLVKEVVRGMESAGQIEQSLALAYWERVVGPQAAAASKAEAVRDGVLIVRTKSSVWSHELSLHKQALLTALNRLLGKGVIKEILFRAQGVSAGPPAADPEVPDIQELDAVALPAEEQARLNALLADLKDTKPEGLQQALAKRMEREARLRRWRLNRGWLACSQCGAAYKLPEGSAESGICPLCRITG
jgi:predicted nucleic acid-binding Zn ribbon protein